MTANLKASHREFLPVFCRVILFFLKMSILFHNRPEGNTDFIKDIRINQNYQYFDTDTLCRSKTNETPRLETNAQW